jgi:hypothetical protein
MNSIEAYILVDELLEKYYESTLLDGLGAMLSDMMPNTKDPNDGLFESMDPAIFESDWTKAWNNIVGKDMKGTDEQVLCVAKVLLDYYRIDMGYEIGDAEAYLREKLS